MIRRPRRHWQFALIGLAISMAAAAAQAGTTIYVKADAAGSDNGTSWANACTRLESALNAAAPGDQIWVAAGAPAPQSRPAGGKEPVDRRARQADCRSGIRLEVRENQVSNPAARLERLEKLVDESGSGNQESSR